MKQKKLDSANQVHGALEKSKGLFKLLAYSKNLKNFGEASLIWLNSPLRQVLKNVCLYSILCSKKSCLFLLNAILIL